MAGLCPTLRELGKTCGFAVFLWATLSAWDGRYAAAAGLDPPQELELPQGEVILEVSGNIGRTNAEGMAVFDREMLEALPQTRLHTLTDWTEGEQLFEGVALETLLELVAARPERLLHALALNGYAIDIPLEHVARHEPLLALRRNGAAMPVRDKGPIWIIYPHDPESGGRSRHNDFMVWQLMALDVQ